MSAVVGGVCGAGVGNIRLGEMLDIYLAHVTFVF